MMRPTHLFIFLGLAITCSLVAAERAHEDNHEHEHHQDTEVDFSLDATDHQDHHDHESFTQDNDSHEHHDEHNEDGHGHTGESDHAKLTPQQQAFAKIEVIVASKHKLPEQISAPGEVVVNSYRTTAVTPRVSAQILKRHVRLGDHVTKGQPLLTLSSVEMAEAQGRLLEAGIEQQRVNALGRKVVSEKRFVASQVAYQRAYSQVSAYGMSDTQIRRLVDEGDISKANGQFQLLSSQTGTIISDDFVIGQIVAPGALLMQVTDESHLWVEARLPADRVGEIKISAGATVTLGNTPMTGTVAQIHHLLDETTRTQAVYIEVNNLDHSLHPGQFVTASIDSIHVTNGITVPTKAVLRSSKGEWRVFVETEAGRFQPKVVELLAMRGNEVVIDGIDEGTRIVGQGAFFVQSEMAKGAFDVHNH